MVKILKSSFIFLCLFLCIGIAAKPHSTFAHSIVRDESTGVEARFHVSPEHDPIVNEESVISFDFSSQGIQADDYVFTLNVTGENGNPVTVPASITSNVLIANYSFPSKGMYAIALDIKPKNNNLPSSVLITTQEVSRGEEIKDSTETTGKMTPTGTIPLAVIFGIAILLAAGVMAKKAKTKKQ